MTTPPTKSSDSRGMLITILAVAGVVGYVFVGFLPAQKALASKRRELREKRQFIANADLKSATLNQLEQQLQAARKHVDSWRERSRMEAGTVALLGELASLAAKAGVILHRITPQDPTNFETMRQQGLEIDVEGTYAQILEFLRGVEARPETIWIPRFEMKPSQETGANVQCALSVVVFADNRGNSG